MKFVASVKNTLRFIVAFMLLALCAPAQTPIASFLVSASQGCAPANIQFTSTSTNAASYSWVFGNGNSSTQANPGNIYSLPGNYTVTLTVTSATGQTSTSSALINVVAAPVASFSASSTVVCEDYSVIQFQNNSTGYDSCVWDFGDGTTSYLVNPSHAYAIDGVFTVKLMVFNKSLGCSGIQVRSGYITVNPRPSAVITVDTVEVCDLNHSFVFSAAVSGSFSSWLWNFGDGTTSGIPGNPSKIYSVAGNYIVSLVIQNSFGCSDTSFLADTIKVYDNPVPVVTVSSYAGCEPLAVTFNCTTPNPATYQWNFGSGLTSNGKHISYSFNAGVYYPVFTVNYLNGCSRQLVLDSIISSPSPSPSFVMSNYIGCAPLTVSFNNTTPGNNSYLWHFGDGDSSIQVNPVHVYDTTGYFVATLTATNSQGCRRRYRNGWYYVNASGPEINFRPDVTTGCSPLTVNFNNYTTGATSYQWDFGDGATSTLQHPAHVYAVNGNYTVRMIASNAMACTDTMIYPVQISVSSMVMNHIPPAPVTICAPYTVFFADNTPASAWLWEFGDGTSSSLSNPSHTFVSPGTYQVDLTVWLANGGCSYKIQNFQTFIVESTRPGFTYTVSPCPPYAVTFTDTTAGASTYRWSFGDGNTSTLQNPVHIYPSPGSYSVNLTATTASGCTTTLSASGGVSFTGLGANPAMVTTDTVAPYTVQFYANSTNATTWLWNFGDGSTSTVQNPVHIYNSNGPFLITLDIANDSCSMSLSTPPTSIGTASGGGGGFGNPTTPVYSKVVRCAPYSVNFYNPFVEPYTLLWVFGDGTTSALENPVHAYSDSGSFIPMLLYTDQFGVTDTLVYSDTFFVAKAPSDFQIVTQNSCNGVIVNVSTGSSFVNNTWDFGNGVIKNGISASHTFSNSAGNYVIRLNSSDTNGCKSYVAKSFSLDLNNPISASTRRTCAGDTVSFLAGNMNFAQYSWDFGDGNSSTSKDPFHSYSDSGLYQVTLLATDINGCTMSFALAYRIEVFKPVASFSILQPYGNCSWVFTRTYNNSTGADSYLWDFGDGATSVQFNPFHYYSVPGYHDITLTAVRNVCQSTYVIPNAIYVAQLSPGFTYVSSGNCLPSTSQFTNSSQDAVSYLWDFGDGDTSALANPSHVYTVPPGTPVSLTVTDANGCVKTIVDTVIVPTAADFTMSSNGGCLPLTVAFYDTSYNAVSWSWDFGDGSFSSSPNPIHSYNADGVYPVTLSVTGPDGCISQKVQNISVMTPVLAFNADSLNGCAPMMVSFANESSGATVYLWDFGDGDISNLENPQHLYSEPGVYTVTLIASNDFGCADTLVMSDYIVTRGSLPDFTLTPLSGCAPLNVQFADASQGAVSWQWYFGDGTSVNGQNVSHVYADSGSFTPSLYTTDSTGCTSVFTYPQPVMVKPMPIPIAADHQFNGCSPLAVNYDASASVADSLIWDMGDGSRISGALVNYIYSVPGIYQVMLIAFNSQGCSDTVSFTPVGVYTRPQVSFAASDTVGCYPLALNFINTSAGLSQATYQWNFGNGSGDTISDPTFIYQNPGVYDVTLVVTNAGACADSMTLPGLITVYDHMPPAEITWKGVTVTGDTEVQLDFIKSTEPDIDHYIVYRQSPLSGHYDSLTVVYPAVGSTSAFVCWKDTAAFPGSAPCSYKVVAIDICGFRLHEDSVEAQTTVHLSTVAGFMKVDLNWSAYAGKTPGGYGIYRSAPGGNYNRIAGVPVNVLNYLDTTAYCPQEYSYRIVAESLDNSTYNSSSNQSNATPSSDIGSQEVSLIRSTVVNNSYTLTEWNEPLQYPWLVTRYQIYRSEDNLQFNLIADVPEMVHEYEDRSVDVQTHEYYYRVTAVSECGTSDYSGPGSSIWLRTRENNLQYYLMWTPYKEWNTGVDSYRIEKLNDNGIWEEFRTVNSSVTEVEEQ
jgi:PKD repeat protein